MLSKALAKQRVHDLSLAAQEQEKRDNKDNRRIVQKYSEIYRRNWHIRPGLIIESAPQLTNQTWSYTTGGSYKLVGQ
jgi:hypothetical protein